MLTSVSKQAIRVNSVLSALRKSDNGDVLDALCYFFVPLLEKWRGKPVTGRLLARGAKLIYGWNLTEAVGQTFLERLLALGFLSPSSEGANLLISTPGEVDSSEVAPEGAGAFLEEVVAKFEEFYLVKQDLLYRRLSTEQLSEMLVTFLVSMDAYSSDRISKEVRERFTRSKRVVSPDIIGDDFSILSTEQVYLCARFVNHLSSTDAELTTKLSSIAGAGLLAEFVEDFRKPTSITTSSATIVILDAPFALRARPERSCSAQAP